MPPHIMILAIGTIALLIGGWIVVRLQRDRHHFRLMQLALERGITAFPGLPPGWLVSLRVGCLTLVMGIGVALSGVVLMVEPSFESTADAVSTPQPRTPEQGPTTDHLDRIPGPDHPPAPAPEPAMERRHRMETQKAAGLVCLCAGVILVLLGTVRMYFAKLERAYFREAASEPRLPGQS